MPRRRSCTSGTDKAVELAGVRQTPEGRWVGGSVGRTKLPSESGEREAEAGAENMYLERIGATLRGKKGG